MGTVVPLNEWGRLMRAHLRIRESISATNAPPIHQPRPAQSRTKAAMKMYRLIMVAPLFLLLQGAPPLSFTATWQSPTVAVLRWQQPPGVALTCLSREASGQRWPITCWPQLAPGATFTTLGATSPLDASAHPRSGDTYRLTFDDRAEVARLGWVVWLAGIRK